MKRMANCRTKGVAARLMAAVLSMSIAAQVTGCAAPASEKATQPEEITENESENAAPAGGEENSENKENVEEGKDSEIEEYSAKKEGQEKEENPEAEETNNNDSATKEYVYDFDALVNDEWKQTAKSKAEEAGYSFYSFNTEKEELLNDRVDGIFETDITSLSEDSDLYKLLYVYNQILAEKWEGSTARQEIKSKLDLIDSVSTREDLYALFTDKFWGRYNLGMARRVNFVAGEITNDIDPQTITGSGRLTDEQKTAVQNYLINLGFSEDRAKQILVSADEMDELVVGYHDSFSEDTLWGYIGREQLEEKNVQFKVLDILSKLDALSRDKDFYTRLDYTDFLDKFYADENIPKIRDQMLVCAAVDFSRFDKEDGGATYYALFPYAPEPDFATCLRYAMHQVTSTTIEKAYKDEYINDKTIDGVKEMIEDIKTSMRTMIDDTDWLSVHGKEQAKHKIFYIREYIGENGHTDDLSEVELTGNPLENYMAIKVSQTDFRDKQLLTDKTDREVFDASFLQANAYYTPYNNSIVVGDGLMEDITDASYEEKLAFWGFVLAHELSHAYDPSGSNYDYEGNYTRWMSEEEYEKYTERTAKIEEFFDGMEVGDGIKIDGKLVCGEAFSDLMSMECCLRILKERENPDYDAFFKGYARIKACYYTQDGLKYAVTDTHLPDKERINYVLGQFDEFYETYDVDPESPYYVPAEKRLSAF